ncbi:MAG: barstar family protein [Proteobacteria bacterium]|nr:barstar family protein [Pseudomonadota bacterium]
MRDVVLTDDTVRGIELLASSLDWPCYVVDLRGCVDKAQLLERCADVLRFPSWFGHNWDAFFDCLIDLASARRARGCVIVLRHAGELQATSPGVVRYGPVDFRGCGKGVARPRSRAARVRRDCLKPLPRSGISRWRVAPAPDLHRRSAASGSARPASCRRR